MYSKFYSPNIIATGSSDIDQSSYSHHADNDVGVAVIDRYTYYNLDFLETQVKEPTSKKTLGDLFGSYDEAKIHSHPGVRYDLFKGGEMEAKRRLVMDFFGNVQNVEIDGQMGGNETQWKEDLAHIERMISNLKERERQGLNQSAYVHDVDAAEASVKPRSWEREKAAKVDGENGWRRQAFGATALLGCVGVWFAGSVLDSRE
ncbi:hypothetical protein LTS18_012919 [Coniosporium uncinatum]|uniref:Uncharacterized protein n=1 Tax=Coniosporium uncinatum TaxID=93489 RepID=A0ACC3DIR9_9PEZI|nr:hypothetical protein LTS18_012919 [Coniosporium uncinatum]